MEYVLLSPNDGELLKKAHQMLLEGGVIDDEKWNSRWNPDVMNDIEGLLIFCTAPRWMNFHNHDCSGQNTIPITITKRNLKKSVATILKAYNASKQ